MISAKRLDARRSKSEGRSFLKYSMLPPGTREIEVQVFMVRETPRLNSPLALDINTVITVDGKDQIETEGDCIPVNLTNMRLMGEKVGDDLEVLRGMFVTFAFSLHDNPNPKSTGDTEVMGFDFVSARTAGSPAQMGQDMLATARAVTGNGSSIPEAKAPRKGRNK